MPFKKLIFLDALRPEEWGQVVAPIAAVTALGSLTSSRDAIEGAKDILMKLYGSTNRDWDDLTSHSQARAVDLLRSAIEKGEVVLVSRTPWPPIAPASKRSMDAGKSPAKASTAMRTTDSPISYSA